MGPGREAATVRQLVLVVVLVGAAFLGGAFVNGPGLRWVQTQLLGSLGLGEEGEIATVDLKGPASPDGSMEKAGAGKAAGEAVRGPVAPVPTLMAEAEAAPAGGRGRRDEPAGSPALGAPSPRRGEGTEVPRVPAPAAAPGSSSAPPPLMAPAAAASRPAADDPRGTDTRASTRAGGPASRTARVPRDPDVTRAAAPTASSSPSSAADRDGRPAPLQSLASLIPEPAPAPPDGLAPPVPKPAAPRPTPTPKTPGDDDWAALARKMQALGVSRFSIEGQPGGRVVFACLIPLAGRQAVAQRFEAEGDDAPQAARAALRRVALWRASQTQPSP
jgi:hypothetical protein